MIRTSHCWSGHTCNLIDRLCPQPADPLLKDCHISSAEPHVAWVVPVQAHLVMKVAGLVALVASASACTVQVGHTTIVGVENSALRQESFYGV
jgi:hypothetical protein